MDPAHLEGGGRRTGRGEARRRRGGLGWDSNGPGRAECHLHHPHDLQRRKSFRNQKTVEITMITLMFSTLDSLTQQLTGLPP